MSDYERLRLVLIVVEVLNAVGGLIQWGRFRGKVHWSQSAAGLSVAILNASLANAGLQAHLSHVPTSSRIMPVLAAEVVLLAVIVATWRHSIWNAAYRKDDHA